MTVTYDRMLLNAAMDHLAAEREDGWLEAARLVVDYGKSITPTSTGIHRDTVDFGEQTIQERISGYVAGQGEFEIRSERSDRVTTTSTRPVERIGHYIVTNHPKNWAVVFCHYRQTGPFRDFNAPVRQEGYAIVHNPSGKPRVLARVLHQRAAAPWWVQLYAVGIRLYHALTQPKRRKIVIMTFVEQYYEVVFSDTKKIFPGDIFHKGKLISRK